MRYGLGVFRVANALQPRCNRVGSGFAGKLNSRAGSKHTDSDFAGNLNSRCGLKTHRSIGKCLLRECLLRARGVPALRCIARRSVPPSATGGSARARRLRKTRRRIITARRQREPRRRRMKRRHEGESGCSAQEKKSALSLHARLAKERAQRETQARAHREKMDRERRLAEELQAKEVLELYASQAARHWL